MKREFKSGTFGFGFFNPRRIIWTIENDRLEAAVQEALARAEAEAAPRPRRRSAPRPEPMGEPASRGRPNAPRAPAPAVIDDATRMVIGALTNLGYTAGEARKAALATDGPIPERIRQALQSLGL